MDEGAGAHNNGNGHAAPTPTPPQSLPTTGDDGHQPAPPVAVAPEVPRDEKGQFPKGKSGNPKGRTPGIPNRNSQLNRGFEAFRANPELCKAALKKYSIRVRGMKAEQLLATLAFAKLIIDGDDSLLRWCGDKIYADPTPPASAAPLIDASDKSQHHHHTENHVRLGEHLSDAGTRDAVAELTQRLASRGAFAGDSRHVRQ